VLERRAAVVERGNGAETDEPARAADSSDDDASGEEE
jgi:hypothetical protein